MISSKIWLLLYSYSLLLSIKQYSLSDYCVESTIIEADSKYDNTFLCSHIVDNLKILLKMLLVKKKKMLLVSGHKPRNADTTVS